jgi:hypothetical protein
MKKELFIIFIVVIIFIYIIYKYFISKDKFKNIKKNDNNIVDKDKFKNIKKNDNDNNNTVDKSIINKFNNNKIIQYFGGDYCPFSNNTSNAYKVMKDFEEVYGNDVTVKYYWVGQDDDIMKKLDVMYVPTILNGNNDVIELILPEKTDVKNLSNDELKDILLETIYNKL